MLDPMTQANLARAAQHSPAKEARMLYQELQKSRKAEAKAARLVARRPADRRAPTGLLGTARRALFGWI
ncbi:MAG: hypothetical protein WEB00_03310 [Dehalococcoidia bacterium]